MALAEELMGVGISAEAAKKIPNGGVAAVTATGSSTLATAVEIKAGVNRITGADGVRLPNANAGSSCVLVNDTGSPIKVWPPAGGAIQVAGTSFGLAVVGTAYSLTTFATCEFTCVVSGAASLWAIRKSA
jgi:hypothetical protein